MVFKFSFFHDVVIKVNKVTMNMIYKIEHYVVYRIHYKNKLIFLNSIK